MEMNKTGGGSSQPQDIASTWIQTGLANTNVPPTKPVKAIQLTSSCRVCSGPASSHLHYGAVCCYSCRAFFRRGPSKTKPYKCIYGTDGCVITQHNRTNCKRCRYQKCIQVGMIPQLIDATKNKDSPPRIFTEERNCKKIEEEKIEVKTYVSSDNYEKNLYFTNMSKIVESMPNKYQIYREQIEERRIEVKNYGNNDSQHYSKEAHELKILDGHINVGREGKIIEGSMFHNDFTDKFNFDIDSQSIDWAADKPTLIKRYTNYEEFQSMNEEPNNKTKNISDEKYTTQGNEYKTLMNNESLKHLYSTDLYIPQMKEFSMDKILYSAACDFNYQQPLKNKTEITIHTNKEENDYFLNEESNYKKEIAESPDAIAKRKDIDEISSDVCSDSLIPLKKRPRMLECSYPMEHAINVKTLPVMSFTSEDKLRIVNHMSQIQSYTNLLNVSLVKTFGNEQFIWLKALESGQKISHTRTEERNWMKCVQSFSKFHRSTIYTELSKLDSSVRNLLFSNTVPALHVLHLAMLEGNKDKNCLEQFKNTVTSSILPFFVGDFEEDLGKVRGMSYKDNVRFISPWAEKISDEEMFDRTMNKVGEMMGSDTELQALYHMLVMITPSCDCLDTVWNDPKLKELQSGLAHLMYRYLLSRSGCDSSSADSKVHLLVMLIQDLHDCANVMHHKSLEV